MSHADEEEALAMHLTKATKDATVAAFFEDDMVVGTSTGNELTTQAVQANQAILVLFRSYLAQARSMKELYIFLTKGIEIYLLYYKVTPDELWGIMASYDRQGRFTSVFIFSLFKK